jgi:predicted secreted Zn-dependent protease
LNDSKLAGIEAKLEGFIELMGAKFSSMEASLNLLQISIDKLEKRNNDSCGKCRDDLDERYRAIVKIVDDQKIKIEGLEKRAGENVKKVAIYIAVVLGGLVIAGIASLVWSAVKGG